MPAEVYEGYKVPIKVWLNDETGVQRVAVEDEAMLQLANLSTLPFVHRHIAAMPDVHWGNGSTVGSVFATVGAIIPAAVGVDIGCGMAAVRTSLTADMLPTNLAPLRSAIEEVVPHGRTNHGGPGDRGAWGNPPEGVVEAWRGLLDRYSEIKERHPKLERNAHPAIHLGTLGTGNHFIEVCLDEEQRVWVMLHSGSRGVGNRIGQYFIEKAKEDMRRWFINLPDVELAYLPEGSEHFTDYVRAVGWAQEFARTNRDVMMRAALGALAKATGFWPGSLTTDDEAVNCHHNYVAKEHHYGKQVWLTRKGAVDASVGKLGIIPGSMGAKSYIVRGKGNPESFKSCSHGAGRKMSRTKAKKVFTLEEHAAATEGVECRKDEDVIDETPGAYKSIEDVMAAQSDLVEIVHTLKQVVCVKG